MGIRVRLPGLLTLSNPSEIERRRFQTTQMQVSEAVPPLAQTARQAWFEAVASRQAVRYQEDVLAAAEAGAELAKRMADAGNFSRQRRQREQLLHAETRADLTKVDRTIEIASGDDMRFSPDEIRIKRGQTKHEMVLGALAELKEHAVLMRKFPEMEYDDPNAVTVEPGKTGELVWRFTLTGDFDFACLVPGHFRAGMRP